MKAIFLCLLVLQVSAGADHTEFYNNFKLIRINPEFNEQLAFLQTVYQCKTERQFDFWQPPSHIGRGVDVLVGPLDASSFFKKLDYWNLTYTIAISDLQQAIASERRPHNKALRGDGYAYDKYNSLADIHNELKRLEKEQPDMITLIDIGQSIENRTLLVIKLSGRKSIAEGVKGSMWIDAGIHAREWIGPATAMHMIRELIHGYKTDLRIQNLLDHLDFYILPVMNPDGYEYSRTKTRLWRKNRRQGARCSGVDLNRNFDYHFNDVESEKNPCHDWYHGPSPFSEPESLAVKNFLEVSKPEAYISLHSYGQIWLLPYAYESGTYSDDYNTTMMPLAIRATEALSGMFGTNYQIGTPADLLGLAGGSTMDWAKGHLNVTYAYAIELSPASDHPSWGFLIPETEIFKTGVETFEAIKVVADQLVTEFVIPKLSEPIVWKTNTKIRK